MTDELDKWERYLAETPPAWRAEREANGPVVDITISTRVPSKWLFHDLETGQTYRHDGETFVRSDKGIP